MPMGVTFAKIGAPKTKKVTKVNSNILPWNKGAGGRHDGKQNCPLAIIFGLILQTFAVYSGSEVYKLLK